MDPPLTTRVGPFGSRKVELPEVQGAIKKTDALQPVGFNRNVIARRPKADVAIQSRQLLRSSSGLLRFARNGERVLDRTAL
jgi:hypothetical protein